MLKFFIDIILLLVVSSSAAVGVHNYVVDSDIKSLIVAFINIALLLVVARKV